MVNIVYEANPPMFRNAPFSFVLGVLIPVIGWIGLLIWWVSTKAKRLVIYNDSLLFEEGLLSKRRTEFGIEKVRTVRVSQSLFQRMFGTGDIEIFTAGDSPELVVKGMPEPGRIRDLLQGGADKVE